MDQNPPTAAELGVTEIEYERIMRGLQQRVRTIEADPGPVFAAPPGEAWRPRRRMRWWKPWAALGAFVVLVSLGASTKGPDPAYAFQRHDGDVPVRYSSCRTIPVEIYPAGGPPDAERLVREAVGRIRSATGLDLVVTGVFGGHAPNWNFKTDALLPDDPVSVSWQDGTSLERMTDDTAGLGGSPAVTAPGGGRRLTSGAIALSREYYAELARDGDHDEALAVLLHEFGHVVGLTHVDSDRELMFHDNIGQTTFGPGDLEGLRLAGEGPCI